MAVVPLFMMQLVLSIVAYGTLARIYVWPWLTRVPLEQGLLALSVIHLSRHIGATVWVPFIVDPAIPMPWKNAVAYGDLLALVCAYLAVFAIVNRSRLMKPLVWLLTIVGGVDLLYALGSGAIAYNVLAHSTGAFWFIPTVLVPALLVSHVLTIALLLRRQ